MRNLAIYDMDKTITRAPTWTRFLVASALARAPWRLALLPVAGVASLGYAAKLIDRAGLKQVTQRLLLGRSLAPAQVKALADGFAEQIVARGVFDGARARIAADRAEGRRLVLATASFRFYAAAIAERLGFDDVVATESRFDANGHLLPLIEGNNCYGPVKLRMIQQWMSDRHLARERTHIRFYSDHVSDAPVLAWADEAVAVNAHGPLRRLAAAKGWETVDFERH